MAPFGSDLFLLFGSPDLSRWRREQQKAMNQRIEEFAKNAEQIPELQNLVNPPVPAR
jgi:hypothetical protein